MLLSLVRDVNSLLLCSSKLISSINDINTHVNAANDFSLALNYMAALETLMKVVALHDLNRLNCRLSAR